MQSEVSQKAADPDWRPVLVKILSSIVLLYSAVATFAVPVQPIAAGLDPSWMYALNRIVDSGFVFGRDLAFTYGPLGFLLNPMDVGSCLAIATVFWIGLHVSLFACIGWRFWNQPGRLAAFSLFYVLLVGLGLWQEHRVFTLLAVLAILTLGPNYSVWFAALAGLCCVFGFEFKWSVGLSASAILGTSLILLVLRKQQGALRVILAGGFGVLLALLASLTYFFHSLPALTSWVWWSTSLAQGYSSTMSLDGPRGVLLLAAIDAAITFVVYLSQPKMARPFVLLLVGPIFLAFKEGFVRQDGHTLAYFLVVSLSLALLLFLPDSRRLNVTRLGVAMVASVSVGLVSALNFQTFPALVWTEVRDLLLLRRGAVQISQLFHFEANRRHLREISEESLRVSVLPAQWRSRITAPRVRTSILPWELSIAAANAMNWQPLPTFQLYTAYTPALDSVTATHLRLNGAEYLVASYEDIDGRNLILDLPVTWRQILSRYRVLESDLSHQRVLLNRVESLDEALTEIASGRASLNDWIEIPRTTKLVFADLDLRTGVLGSLRNSFYQLPPTYMEFQRQAGRVDRYRVVTRNVVNGILANYLPVDHAAFEDLLQGQAEDPIIRLRVLSSGGGRYLTSPFSWRLRESRLGVRQQNARVPEPPLITSAVAFARPGGDPVLAVTATDPTGSRFIQVLQLLVSTAPDGANACYLSYQPGENLLSLIADAGRGVAGQGSPGQLAVLENSQCSVDLGGAETQFDNYRVSLRVPVKFRAPFKGMKHIRAYAVDRLGRHSEWTMGGNWEIK